MKPDTDQIEKLFATKKRETRKTPRVNDSNEKARSKEDIFKDFMISVEKKIIHIVLS